MKKLFLMALVIFSSLYSTAQFKEVSPAPGGIYIKALTGRGLGLSMEKLYFTNNNAYANIDLGPGSGLMLAVGTGLRNKLFDVELLLEESMVAGFFASSGSGGSVTVSSTFFKTNLYCTGYFKIPLKKEHNYFRIGGGGFMCLPGKFKVKLNGDKLGYARYNATTGLVGDLNIMFAAKAVYVNPGLRLKIAEIESKEITFTENLDELSRLDISSIDLYLSLQF